MPTRITVDLVDPARALCPRAAHRGWPVFSREIAEHAKALGVTPDAFATQVDIAMAMGQSRAEAIATVYLHFASPGFDAYAEIRFDSEQAEEDAACQLDADIPAPWEPTEPEEMYAESVKNRRLHKSGTRPPNSAKGKQPSRMRSQRDPLHDDGKEGA